MCAIARSGIDDLQPNEIMLAGETSYGAAGNAGTEPHDSSWPETVGRKLKNSGYHG